MILNQQTVSKILRVLVLLLTLIHLVQGGSQNPFRLDDKIHSSFDPNYFEKFLEPDSEEYRNISCSKYWHVKEMLQVLEMWEHPGEEHVITTDDGYIISIFRIISNELKPNTTPVLILPGFLAAPEVFLQRGKEDLPIILADSGYDVWMGNFRGNHYGRKHVNMTTKDEKFWDFTFHEQGYYDVPSMIDHIQRTTGSQRVSVIAHSMGNAALMVMLALRPEYNDKIGMFVSLAPYAVSYMNLPVTKHGFLLMASLLPVIMAYFPSGSSNKNLIHLVSISNRQFRQFDYGPKENMIRYKRTRPPVYNLKNVRVPTSLYYGETDNIVSIKAMKAQVKALPNVVKTKVLKGYNHVDFVSAITTKELLYDSVLEDLEMYGMTTRR